MLAFLESLCSPGMRLMQRLRMPAKFVVIALAFLVPLSVTLYAVLDYAKASIDFAVAERLGVTQLRSAQRALADASGTSSSPVASTLATFGDAIASDHDPLQVAAPLAEAREAWRAAQDSQSTSVARRKLLALFTAISDNSKLTLDPDLDSYYAMAVVVDSAPRTMLAAAELRDFIAQNRNTQSELLLLLTRCVDASESMSQSLQRAEHATPSLRQALARDDWESARVALVRLSEQASTDGDTQRALASATEQLIGRTSEVMERSTKALDDLLDQRIEGFEARRNVILALVLACCVLSAYFISSFYFSSIRGFAALAGRMKKLARGDLSPNYPATGSDEIGSLINSFDNSREQLERLVSRIQQTADSIGIAGRKIATANSDLAERGSAQSAVIGQTSERVKQISDKAQSNLGNSAEANRLAERAYGTAERGKQVVDNVVQTMGAMTESSHRIEAIIGVINEIAFQTNLLALNAAVEAARAGEQGRGFAVVAGEVRSLAQRSANAANEIKALIQRSVEDVNRGAELVSQAGTTMHDILQSVRSVSHLMTQTAQASETQATNITAVEQAVSKIDDDARQNAAIVEQTAAAAGLLKDQVMLLLESVRHFTVSDRPQHAAVHAPASQTTHRDDDLPIARVA